MLFVYPEALFQVIPPFLHSRLQATPAHGPPPSQALHFGYLHRAALGTKSHLFEYTGT
jgi:hypothetical protein